MGNESRPSTSDDDGVATGNESRQNISFDAAAVKAIGVHQSTAFDGEGAKANESHQSTSFVEEVEMGNETRQSISFDAEEETGNENRPSTSFEEVVNVSQSYTSSSAIDANSYSCPSQYRYRCQKTKIYPSSNPYRNLTTLPRPMQPVELPKAWEHFGGTLSSLR